MPLLDSHRKCEKNLNKCCFRLLLKKNKKTNPSQDKQIKPNISRRKEIIKNETDEIEKSTNTEKKQKLAFENDQ